MTVRGFIALGSNQGDRQGMLDQTLDALREDPLVNVTQVSSYYNTEAVIPVENYSKETLNQDDYLNAVAAIETEYTVRAFFKRCAEIEKEFGRRSKGDYAPRTIDVDLLFFESLESEGSEEANWEPVILNDVDLVLPHPRAHEREFVLQPLSEIDPAFVHPLLNQSIESLWRSLKEENSCVVE